MVPFTAGDGLACNLLPRHRRRVEPTKGPALLVHGAGVRANIFRPPTDRNLVRGPDRIRLRRLARELARQHRHPAQPLDPRSGGGLRSSRGGADGRRANGRRADPGGDPLPGLDQLHDVRCRGPRPAGRPRGRQRRHPAPGRPSRLALAKMRWVLPRCGEGCSATSTPVGHRAALPGSSRR